jgi:hypothetical protein
MNRTTFLGALIGAGAGGFFKGTTGLVLDGGASSADTVLGFALALAVGLGVICAGALLGRALRRAQQTDLSQPNPREMETLREH